MVDRSKREIRWPIVALATLMVGICMWLALHRIHVQSDLTAAMPAGSPVLDSGRRLLKKHPLIDWVAMDLSLRNGASDSARLVAAAEIVQTALRASGQFASVGTTDWAEGIGALHESLAERLPSLFTREELDRLVTPRLSEAAIRARLEDSFAKLGELEGVGQARDLAADPLGLNELVYARLSALFPKTGAKIEGNQLLSTDGKHLLLTAVPHHALGDPESSRRIAAAIDTAQLQLGSMATASSDADVIITSTGAYRAAMDNEAIVKADTNRAVWLVTIAVSVLLLGCFSRPLLGLLTLLPATAGVAFALLLYSFFSPSMSALALGFGAALISITVDQGIVYIAYLDRVRGATGRKAAKQTFSAVSLATLTTVGAFFALRFSGYQLLEELGIFAALGSAFSFAFVHTIFPLVFRATQPTRRRPLLPVDAWLRWAGTGRVGPRVAIAGALALGLGAFARPHFEVDLNRLNTVSAATRAADERVRQIWGDLMSRAYILVEAKDPDELQQRSDRLNQLLTWERANGSTSAAFSISELWPGRQLAEQHLADWQGYWDPARRAQLKQSLATAAQTIGFATDAFEPFIRTVEQPHLLTTPIPQSAYALVGLAKARDGDGWVWLGAFERGPRYDAAGFASRAAKVGISVFDGAHFARGLNDFLGRAFGRMLLIVTPFVLIAVGLSFFNWRLILLVLFPVVLSLVATLGTLGLLGRPIDIPGLMIAVVVLGMGTNFSVYLVNAHQRYPDPSHPIHDSVRIAALLDGGATVLGMTVMSASKHAAAQSAGMSGLLGIGFSLFGALVLLPPILHRLAPIGGAWTAGIKDSPRRLFLSRFRFLEPGLVWAAWRRSRSDRRLDTLPRLIGGEREVAQLGSGGREAAQSIGGEREADQLEIAIVGHRCSIEAAWILANCQGVRAVVVELDEDHVHVTRAILGDRGQVIGSDWSAVAELRTPIQAVLLLDGALRDAGQDSMNDLTNLAQHIAPRRIIVELTEQQRGPVEQALEANGYALDAIESVGFVVWERQR